MVEAPEDGFAGDGRLPNFSSAHVFRPPRRDGAAVAAAAAGVAFVLAIALIIRGILRGISFAAYGGDVLALLLFCLAALFGYWAYALYSLRYLVDDEALVVVWGVTRQFIPVAQVQRIVLGRRLGTPRIRGVVWPGCHVGRGRVERLGEVFFYSAHRSPADLVYVGTPAATFGLSPADARGMARTIQAAQERAGVGSGRTIAAYRVLPVQPLLRDGPAVLLAGAAVVIFLLAAGYIASRYQALPVNLPFSFPPTAGPQRIGQRSELLRLPATAFLWLLAGVGLAAWSHARLRAVSYSLLAGTLFAECLYAVAALAAVH